ncbi:MAG: amidohydrolase [Acidimicrobiales bacterium]|jgi:aminocarboxymuconate-semialdehyde decarboxylase|nr:amidohydrolase [Acidimicrobiales bacterium]
MIDLHAHVVLDSVLGAAGDLGPELDDGDETAGRPPCFRVGSYTLVGVRYRGSPFMDLDRRLEAMDAADIDVQVLSPNPLTYFSHVEAEWADRFCRRHNDELAALVARAPERIRGFAQLPMQDPPRARAELERAVGELGLVAPYLGTDLGRPLDDPAFDEIWATCVGLDVPVFFHPAPDGIDRPRRDERLERFDGDLWLGFLYEETLAVSALVLGGVLDRHPGLDVCISHGGGATSWLAERMAHAARTRPWARGALREPGAVAQRLGRIWWDAHVGGPWALAALLGAFGPDRLVAGTNLAGWDQSSDPSWGDAALAATMDANARRLLRLDRR